MLSKWKAIQWDKVNNIPRTRHDSGIVELAHTGPLIDS